MTTFGTAPDASLPLPTVLVTALSDRFGPRLSRGESVRLQHGRDESKFPPAPPDAVVFVETTEEVAAVVTLCREHRVPVIPYGAGSSAEGHVLAVRGGLCVDLSGMNRVLAIHPEDQDVTVQAGVTRLQLNRELKGSGLFFSVDPGADATLGGMAATAASGTNAVRYGTMRENVRSMSVVCADGRVVKTGNRARKSAAGYDLTHLFIGSEGTFGIITELTLRLFPVPEAVAAAVCAFPTVAAAVQTVIQVMQLGIPVARCELLDALTLKAVNRYSKTTLSEQPTLFFEFHGSTAAVEEQSVLAGEIAREQGGQDFAWATRPEDRSRLWQARHDAFFACLQLKPGATPFVTDVCVPISALAVCIEDTIKDVQASSLPMPLFGHVGDGNFHMVLLIDGANPEEREEAERINEQVIGRALALGGTCTGEHGVGIGKAKHLVREHGQPAIDLMQVLKAAIDPDGLFNPGKILPRPA
ncbi:FAD-binding oxidoreductase [Azospirillum picis]|uniref:D-lactate dehydrogenase (cytochrome) n=1 Tax=Azospirillum picis TaxID=488438 RepID=A0ABU0MI94_9PROT|nr:FAD-linked oxidase C-terminal domain-containing protein [Azospirillum picis]MBP2298807.1 D-lactate dehydrogenase (cytochrome) [Azospirillum picis]MDQ0532951.1 D-lactate dehydrogenase (cytochrome) [Azospirillum picis]